MIALRALQVRCVLSSGLHDSIAFCALFALLCPCVCLHQWLSGLRLRSVACRLASALCACGVRPGSAAFVLRAFACTACGALCVQVAFFCRAGVRDQLALRPYLLLSGTVFSRLGFLCSVALLAPPGRRVCISGVLDCVCALLRAGLLQLCVHLACDLALLRSCSAPSLAPRVVLCVCRLRSSVVQASVIRLLCART